MAGRIRTQDVEALKERASIEEVVREHVTLRPAGPGRLSGLCPFHDEKTPSFTVRPAVGAWHCFGCGEGGDIIDFVRRIDHLDFADAVERLASRVGMELRYEETSGAGGRRGSEGGLGRRARLVEAHRVAAEFYHHALVAPGDEPRAARDFLRAKGFGGSDAERFQVGYSSRSGEALTRHLRERGFTEDEMVIAGLSARGARGLYDRFRGRVMWPIRDITGDPIGFGARRLFDDDRIAAKYLNTSETPIYKKTSVLYGLDVAKKAMAQSRRAVVVEGYTDVMAAHLAGVETAVATCGTAFGSDHITLLRRILRDEPGLSPARVIFTFDGDAAGQKAAMKAFAQDQRWAAQSYVAVAPAGQDPNDLRLSAGDEAVRALIESARPMFEFAVRTTIAPYDLSRPEERVAAMRAVAPIVAGIKDRSLRPEYVREVAGWLGVDRGAMDREVGAASRRPVRPGGSGAPEGAPDQTAAQQPRMPAPDLRDPVQQIERQLLQVALQHPQLISPVFFDAVPTEAFRALAHQGVREGMRQAGGLGAAPGMSAAGWAAAVAQAAPPVVQPLVHELAVAGLPVVYEAGQPPRRYVEALVLGLRTSDLDRRLAEAMSALQRADPGSTEARRLNEQLTQLHQQRARLRAGGE